MTRRIPATSLIGPVMLLLASLASGHSFAQGQPSVGEKLVVGDWYQITIARHGVKESLRGHLVQATDDWIVLGVMRCQSETTEVPWLGEMPYVGRLFRKNNVVNLKVFTWVPRQDAVIEKRTPCSNPSDFKPFIDGRPTLEDGFSLCWVENNKRMEDSSKFSDAAHRHFQITRFEQNTVTSPDSHSSKFPVVGASFKQDTATQRKITKEIELNDVLFVQTQNPIDASKVSSVP